MQSDERDIRQLVATWMAASKIGDVDQVLSLMTEDVVFLVPGQAPMGKSEFAAVMQHRTGDAATTMEGVSEIQEIKVLGDWAFMWTKLRVAATPPDGPTIHRAGHTLSVLKKERGKWLMARDANLLAS